MNADTPVNRTYCLGARGAANWLSSPTRNLRIVVAVLLTVSSSILNAQTTGDDAPKFDVASVKPNKSGEASLSLDVQPGGRFIATNIPLKQLIRAAYTLQLHQIVGAPSWVDAERFDIKAVSSRDLTVDTPWTPGGRYAIVQLMVQALLADRFKMVGRVEERAAQGYALVVNRPGVGPKLTPAKVPCEATCGVQSGPGRLSARGVPMPTLAEFLSQLTGRLVVDATGLAVNYDFDLRWTPDAQLQADSDSPSIFTALQEQAGLRLQSRRVQMNVLVIASIDRPTPD
jgi:uncharacterized protein (TIGR03435 family)